MARFVLCLMLLGEILGSAYGSYMCQSFLPVSQSYLWSLLSAVLLLVFFPVTVVFLFSTFCQLNKDGELLPDSLVARIAMRVSEKTRETREVQYCPTFWRAVGVLIVIWGCAIMFVGPASVILFNTFGIGTLLLSFLSGLIIFGGLAILFALLWYLITLVIQGYISLRGWGVDRSEVSLASRVFFFFVWGSFWTGFYCVEYFGHLSLETLSLSGIGSLIVVGCFTWVISFVCWTRAVGQEACRSFGQSLVYEELVALKNGLCPRVKIASK